MAPFSVSTFRDHDLNTICWCFHTSLSLNGQFFFRRLWKNVLSFPTSKFNGHRGFTLPLRIMINLNLFSYSGFWKVKILEIFPYSFLLKSLIPPLPPFLAWPNQQRYDLIKKKRIYTTWRYPLPFKVPAFLAKWFLWIIYIDKIF